MKWFGTPRRLAIALGLVALLAGIAAARPGGGDSYTGGGGHSSGGGGSGGGDGGGDLGAVIELLYWLVRLTIEFPQVMLPVIGIGLGYVAYNAWKQHQNKDWNSGPPVQLERAVSLEALRRVDDDFSQPAFEDFVFRLFSTAHRARHTEEALANAVGPYVSAAARTALRERPPVGEPVQSVVVGAMRTFDVSIPTAPVDAAGQPNQVRVAIELEANTTTWGGTYFTVETWVFTRDATRRSKPPSPARTFPCPNCGAPWAATATGTQVCAACGQTVDNGRFDWTVADIAVRSSHQRQPTLTDEVPERGNDVPTYRQPGVDAAWVALERSDALLTDTGFQQRLALVYDQLNRAWSNTDLEPARGLVTDGMFDYLQYWVDAYVAQGLRNHLVDMRITHQTIAKVTRDKYYDAVTVRIWATGKDYVVRKADGDIVRGSKRRERAYSEYWTLIRSAARKGAPTTSAQCSNCGAPLEVTQAGACKYCNAHVTAGEFDWVLSKIEQDDSYRG